MKHAIRLPTIAAARVFSSMEPLAYIPMLAAIVLMAVSHVFLPCNHVFLPCNHVLIVFMLDSYRQPERLTNLLGNVQDCIGYADFGFGCFE